jgi:vitamin B12 transporter
MIAALFGFSTALTIDPELVVTAARQPVAIDATPALVDIIDTRSIESVETPQLVDLLRLAPGVSIARAGSVGAQTQVRLRGAEANHTLVFVDGIEANDPASSGEFRWETLAADGIDRVELLRGPQSALWGSEAIGGVVAVTSRDPGLSPGFFGSAEGGSFDTLRLAGGVDAGSDKAGIVVQASRFETDGIDSFSGGISERDGFRSLTASAKAVLRPTERGEIVLVARHVTSRAEFDGFDPTTFLRADTPDQTRIRSTALRAHVRLNAPWRHELFGTYLTTDNINRSGDTFVNRTDAETFRAGYQTGFTLSTGAIEHRLTGAAEYREQIFTARDEGFFGGTNQRRRRDRVSLIADYGLAAGALAVSASIRHDDNDRFANATTWRLAARYGTGDGWSLNASAGRGVTDPTFTEMFGFFPGSFVGNPDLKPERAFGWDVGIGYRRGPVTANIGYFDVDLEDEIVSTFDPATFLSSVANATGSSRRRGVEASVSVAPRPWLSLAGHYTYLDADEGQVAGAARVREVRRASHTAGVSATAELGTATVSLLANYVGPRRDVDFDSFPARDVSLGDYVLATMSASVPLGKAFTLTARVENLFDVQYEDVFGYATQGIAAYGGLRVRWGG